MTEQLQFPFYLRAMKPKRAVRERVEMLMEDRIELLEKPKTRGPLLNRPEAVASYLASEFAWRPAQEKFFVLPLNRKNFAIGKYLLSIGTATSALAHPREVFRVAILAGATAVICVHNHPSGDPAPSSADIQLTRQLRDASRAVDIDLLDHVIVGEMSADPRGLGHYSFRQAGIL